MSVSASATLTMILMLHRAEAFVGQRILFRIFAGTQARPGRTDIVGQAVVWVQNLEQRWHGVAEIR